MRFLFMLILPILTFSYEWTPPQLMSKSNITGHTEYSRFGLDGNGTLWCFFNRLEYSPYQYCLYGGYYSDSQWSEPMLVYTGGEASGFGGFDATRAEDGKLWVLTAETGIGYGLTMYYNGSVWSDTFVIPGLVGFKLAADSIGKVWAMFNAGEDYRIWCDVCEDTVWSGPYVVCSYPTGEQVWGSNITVDPRGIRWVGGTAISPDQGFLCHSDSTGAWSDTLIMVPSELGGVNDIIADNDGNIWVVCWYYAAYLDTNFQWSPYYEIAQWGGYRGIAVDSENKVWIFYEENNTIYYRVWNGIEWSPEESIVTSPVRFSDVFYDPLTDRVWISYTMYITQMSYVFTTWTHASTETVGSSEDGVMSEDFLIGCSDYPGYHWYPAVAYDGVNYLAIWQSNDTTTLYNIWGARVTHDGTILDTQSITITAEAWQHSKPKLAFDGINYLTVYDTPGYDYIYGTIITPAGVVLDHFPIIDSIIGIQRNPDVIFDGVQYFVVWQEKRAGNWDIYGARVTTDGVTLDSLSIPICAYVERQYIPAVSFDGSNYLVVWQDFRNGDWDIYGARVTTDGVVIDDGGIVINASSGSQTQPGIAFDGDNYLVVWRDKRLDSNGDVYGARVTPDGVVLEPGGFPVTTAAGKQSMPSVIFDDTDYFVTWEDSRDGYYGIYGAKVNTSGVVIDTFCISSREGEQLAPALAKGDDQILVAYSGWTGEPYKCQRIWGVFYPPVGIHEHETNFDIPGIRLLQIQPNPAAKDAIIKYIISQKAKISLSLYDNSGRLVKRIFDGERMVGNYTEKISLKNYPNGVYHLILKTSDKIVKKKVVLIK